MRYWFSCFLKFTAFLVPSVEPAFVGIHDFLNPPPWIHMVDYRYVSPGVFYLTPITVRYCIVLQPVQYSTVQYDAIHCIVQCNL